MITNMEQLIGLPVLFTRETAGIGDVTEQRAGQRLITMHNRRIVRERSGGYPTM
jgi:hypothetical protein